MPGFAEGLILSTCNRTEFYFSGEFRDSQGFFETSYEDFRVGDEMHLFRLWGNDCVRIGDSEATSSNDGSGFYLQAGYQIQRDCRIL